MVDNLRLNFFERSHIVVDVGLTHTKAGFVKDNLPMAYFQTPLTLV
jgi:actin-related protein